MKKPILISGIQPTGRLHLGNYLGALKNFVELQNSGKYDCYFFIADYHSLTANFNPKEKTKEVLDVANTYITAGLNPKKSTIFVQSQIPETTELTWILNTITPLGELSRMTQFKEKADVITLNKAIISPIKDHQKNLTHVSELLSKKVDQIRNMGLFDYPVLMAADILLYNAKFVPVGEDQIQHMELTRTLARKFNNKFGDTFPEPESVLTKTSRVMSLKDPNKKMSKSQPDGCLFLDDSPQEIEKKIKSAVTDSESEVKYSHQNKAGISNLMDIYSALSEMPISAIEKKYKGRGYGDFKKDLIKIVTNSLKPFRELKTSNSKLKTILDAGAKKAQKIAQAKIREVKEKLGLLS